MGEYERVKQDNQKEVQEEIKKMAAKRDRTSNGTGKDKQNGRNDNERKSNDNKYAIMLDNIALKLGVQDKKDIVNVLKSKLQYLKTHNMPKYLQLMGQK